MGDDLERRVRETLTGHPGPGAEAWERMRAAVLAAVPGAPPRRRPRRRWLLALVPLALIGAGAAWASLRPTPTAQLLTTGVACVSEPVLDARSTAILDDDGRGPVATCAGVWERGELGGPAGSVPELVACDPRTGAVYVFPTANPRFCERSGFAPLPADYAASSPRFASFREAVTHRLGLSGRCVGPVEARAVVRRALDAHGLAGWSVAEGPGLDGRGFDATMGCASLFLDGARATVVLVPGPAPLPPALPAARAALRGYGLPLSEAARVATAPRSRLYAAQTREGVGACMWVDSPAGQSGACVPSDPGRPGPALDRMVLRRGGETVLFGRLHVGHPAFEPARSLEIEYADGAHHPIPLVGFPLRYFVFEVPPARRDARAVALVLRDRDGRELAREAGRLDHTGGTF